MAATQPDVKPDTPEKDAAPSGGGLKAWLPLILTVVLMPVIAFAMTNFVLLPKLMVVMGSPAPEGEASGGTGDGHGTPADDGHGGGGGHGGTASHAPAGKGKHKVALDKLVVNVSGSLGTRLLLCSLTLTGSASDFKSVIENNTELLRDVGSSVLASKTIQDLEKPEARNLIRTELLTQFNAGLGRGLVQDIYITELAIQ